jgi:tetratricopeptide (TPR) repeat protein
VRPRPLRSYSSLPLRGRSLRTDGAAAAWVCLFILGAFCALLFVGFARRPLITAAATQQEPTLNDPDRTCAECHADIYERYQKTPMARGSGVAINGLIEGDFTHSASGIRYRLFQHGGQAWMAYDRKAGGKGPELHGEQALSFYVGSGRRGRTYIFDRDGWWFEAPVNYYSKKKLWDMAPNYGSAASMPATLPVDSNCLHCHASEVQTPLPEARNRYAGAPFLAGGVTCAACHGDPAQHLAQQGRGAIVNPAKQPPVKRDSVCLQCHLEAEVTIYRAGKSLAAYEPGDDLSDFAAYFVDGNKQGGDGRATSQYEALLRSACKRASGDKLTCTSCHDPHGSPEADERVSFYRGKCLACHTGEKMANEHHPEQQDCATCHMPMRETTDISHEQLTDHDIERHPREDGGKPGGERETLVPVGDLRAGDRELGLAYAELAERGDRRSGERALMLLTKAEREGMNDADLHVQLGYLEQISGRIADAKREYQAALTENPYENAAMANLAIIDATQGNIDAALKLIDSAVANDPSQTAAGLDLAFLECRLGDKEKALRALDEVGHFNPDNRAVHEFIETGHYGGQSCKLR